MNGSFCGGRGAETSGWSCRGWLFQCLSRGRIARFEASLPFMPSFDPPGTAPHLAEPGPPAIPHPNAWAAFWRTLVHFDHAKLNPWMGLRNAIAVALPLCLGEIFHQF